jgi:hypothetical protein
MPRPAVSRETHVFCIASHDIQRYWNDFAHHIERFCREAAFLDSDEHTPEAIRESLSSAKRQLWGFHDGGCISGIAITAIEPPVCWIWGACGTESFDGQTEEVVAAIEQWAGEIGCRKLRIRGRVGWERKLSGFKRIAVILEKVIHGHRNQS